MNDLNFKIFIVDDDPWYGQFLAHLLSSNPDYEIKLFTSATEFLLALNQHPDLVCMDFGLPDYEGDKLLLEIQKKAPGIPVIVISGQEEIAVAVNLLKAGAKDYIIKDKHTKDLLWRSVINVRENISLKKQVEELTVQLEEKYTFEKTIIGQSASIKKTFTLVQKAIQSNINVSLTGETGTGKEVFAKAIHFNCERKKKNFIAVNMAAIPGELAESELFGHEKGAFTGAIGLKKGKFEEANGGTLFLDEIGEMDLSLQSKLLRVLQEREVVRVGGSTPIPVDVRLISATHKDLADEVKKGAFREDLYFRIIGLPIHLPPLRDRQNDVLILAKYFIEEFARLNKCEPPILSYEAKEKLKKYAFPGNVRELKAVIDLACVMSNGKEVTAEDVTFYSISDSNSYSFHEKTLKEYNIDIITNYLKKYDNNILLTADKLGIGKSTIYNLIKSGDIKISKS